MALIPSALSLDLAFNAAVTAQMSVAHRDDHAAAHALACISACFLIAAFGFLLLHRASLARFNDVGAARMMPAAPVSFRAPHSLQAPARVSPHGFVDLLARDDR